jgi:hypothetical protein
LLAAPSRYFLDLHQSREFPSHTTYTHHTPLLTRHNDHYEYYLRPVPPSTIECRERILLFNLVSFHLIAARRRRTVNRFS